MASSSDSSSPTPMNTRSQTKRNLGPDAVAAARKRHKEARAVAAGSITWNMQGAGTDVIKIDYLVQLMRVAEVDVICLQECGNLFGWQGELQTGWVVAMHEQWNAGGGNNRCSLAILTRTPPTRTHRIANLRLDHRPMIGAEYRGRWFWCVHGPRTQTYVRQALLTARHWSPGQEWCVLGDFNVNALHGGETVDIGQPPAQCLKSGRITHPGSGTELDYGYFFEFGFGAIRRDEVISDHYAVQFVHP